MTWFYRDLKERTGLEVPCLKPHPDLHLAPREKIPPISGRYWLVFGGGKTDFTTQHWDFQRYQQLVDRLRPYGLRFAQSGAVGPMHVHPPMERVLDLRGWGGIRELIRQIYHCEGVICPITAAMHIAAAFRKPCVVIAGGREEPWWEAYDNQFGQFGPEAEPVRVPHRFLHTVGLLPCCQHKGCWKNKVVQINNDRSLCVRLAPPRPDRQQPLPLCMDMITVDHVIEAVLWYYQEGYLPPIGLPPERMAWWYRREGREDLMPEDVLHKEKLAA